MTEQTTCSCGQNEKKRFIIPCAGQANTGQITNAAAIQLTDEGFGKTICVALLATGNEGLVEKLNAAEDVVILDGCKMKCAAKIAAAQGVVPTQNLVMTDLGFVKGPSRSYTDDDVEKVAAACWMGRGRESEEEKEGHCTCSCGCGGSCE
ncbi:conserved hypothetical protein [Methanocorpusculum labreanum Z]|uniref:DGC domain protein n=1 Tax=Methanocorpusculum labreanum (strain ATCC 43576 / DSM 4855 / Z) TaxID=410358 RepID=A2SRM9_METLZ|nr:putative zinc-binding protein [Methanocorpusculum labreanum]ABN06985.1 conserved hypothetical protein [Methanocorpusculum labreanum Z]